MNDKKSSLNRFLEAQDNGGDYMINKRKYLVKRHSDLKALKDAGLQNVVYHEGPLKNADEWLAMGVQAETIVLLYEDSLEAPEAFNDIMKSGDVLLSCGLSVMACYGMYQQPREIAEAHKKKGFKMTRDDFERYIIDYIKALKLRLLAGETASYQKKNAIKRIAESIGKMKDELAKRVYLNDLAKENGIPVEMLLRYLDRVGNLPPLVVSSNEESLKVSIIGIERLRDSIDGKGIRTLVLFDGCPLHCHYCINRPLMESGIMGRFTPKSLWNTVLIDTPYYQVSGGGITFGGGEPALQSEFIRQFSRLNDGMFSIALETSLNVQREHIIRLAECIDEFIVDIKDMNPEKYLEYTGTSGEQAYSNLQWLVDNGYGPKIKVRVPLIPGYNDTKAQKKSVKKLQDMGLKTETFSYVKTHDLRDVLENKLSGAVIPSDYSDYLDNITGYAPTPLNSSDSNRFDER